MSAQAMQALAKANEVYRGGAAIRRELGAVPYHESRCRLADLLEDPPPPLLSMRLLLLLRAVHRVEAKRARDIIRDAGIPPGFQVRPLRALTPRQRAALAFVLRNGA